MFFGTATGEATRRVLGAGEWGLGTGDWGVQPGTRVTMRTGYIGNTPLDCSVRCDYDFFMARRKSGATLTLPLTRRRFLWIGAAAAGVARCSSPADTAPPAPPADGARWRLGCYTRPWGRHDYRVALDAVAEAGFRSVGLMGTATGLVISRETSVDEAVGVGEEARQRNLEIASAWSGDIGVDESLERGIADMRRLIDCCAVAGVGNLLMGGVENENLVDPYYRAIAETCDYAAENGVGISVKPHGGANTTGPQCRELIERVGHRNFGLWYDPGNIFYYTDGELDPVEDSKTVDGLVVGMSVKDYEHPRIVDLTPGTGRVDFRSVMTNLVAGGFREGPLVVETLKPGTLPDLAREAVQARRFLESVLEDLG
jgi:sugar phosphate isomerase/epimerase